jgi:3',5'-cyclic AMP phosphodiesterase CpdA
MYTLAHISDPHLAPLPRPTPALLSNKRILGFLSWTLRRRRVHQASVLARLAQDMQRQGPDHVAVTGDITNISLPAEFEQAARWLADVGPAEQVSVIPGNHDAYVGLPWRESLGWWADYMSGLRLDAGGWTDEERAAEHEEDFPYLRLRGPLAILGVSSACPTAPFSAAGAVGKGQLGRLSTLLNRLASQGCFRVVLIHHPPLPGGAARRKQLRDSAAFREVMARCGAELILHGHTHRSALARVEGRGGAQIPVIGVASASAGRDFKGKGLAQYHLYRVTGSASDGWALETEVRAIGSDLDRFETTSRFTMRFPE